MAMLAPNDEEMNGGSSDNTQSTATTLMTTQWNTSPTAATNWPGRPVVRGSRNASTLQPAMAISDRPMKNGVLR